MDGKRTHPVGHQLGSRIKICIREEELTSTRESINEIKTALEHGLKEMEASRSIVTSQLTMVTGGINSTCQNIPLILILTSLNAK